MESLNRGTTYDSTSAIYIYLLSKVKDITITTAHALKSTGD